jgi:hypothetical protein
MALHGARLTSCTCRFLPPRCPRTKRSRSSGGCFAAMPTSIRWLGEQGRQDRLFTSVRQRMAGRHLRKAAHQVLRLRKPAPGPADRSDPLRPSCRPSHRWRVSAADRRHVPLPGSGFRRRRMARRRAGVRTVLPRAWRSGRDGSLPLRQWCPCMGVLLIEDRGKGCTAARHGAYQPHLRSNQAAQAHLKRPAVSEPGHDAQRRLRQLDRAAASEGTPRKRGKRLRGRRPAAVSRPVGVSRFSKAHGTERRRADDPAGDRRLASSGRHLH